MRTELTLSLATLFGFLLVLARVSSAFVFVPLPGVRKGPELARIVLALSAAMALFPYWPQPQVTPSLGLLAGWLLMEAALGIMIGLTVAFLTEAFLLAAQAVGLPAGYAYASVVDPQTQADSGVLLVFAQLSGGMLFFALGLDREIIRVFARSLETCPPSSVTLPRPAGEAIIRLGAGIFTTGMRLAMPALALLVLVDIALALLGRLHSQLQLLILSFPVKMLAAIGVLAWTVVLFPKIYSDYGAQALSVARGLVARGGG